MPWDISTHPESTNFTVRRAQTEFRDALESLPGLMIFQKPGDDPAHATILFIFVVGETPTGGLRREQFRTALKIRQNILAGADPNLAEAKVLRIDGPMFSGSLLSLDAVLNSQPHDRFSTILIRSGTVSSASAVRDFIERTKKQWPDTTANGGSPSTVTHNGRPDFATFEFSDE